MFCHHVGCSLRRQHNNFSSPRKLRVQLSDSCKHGEGNEMQLKCSAQKVGEIQSHQNITNENVINWKQQIIFQHPNNNMMPPTRQQTTCWLRAKTKSITSHLTLSTTRSMCEKSLCNNELCSAQKNSHLDAVCSVEFEKLCARSAWEEVDELVCNGEVSTGSTGSEISRAAGRNYNAIMRNNLHNWCKKNLIYINKYFFSTRKRSFVNILTYNRFARAISRNEKSECAFFFSCAWARSRTETTTTVVRGWLHSLNGAFSIFHYSPTIRLTLELGVLASLFAIVPRSALGLFHSHNFSQEFRHHDKKNKSVIYC